MVISSDTVNTFGLLALLTMGICAIVFRKWFAAQIVRFQAMIGYIYKVKLMEIGVIVWGVILIIFACLSLLGYIKMAK
jgi:hypothetical protein